MAPQAPSLDLLISNSNAGHGQIIEMENEEEDEDAAAERQSLRRGQSQSVFGKIRHRQESQYKISTLDTSGPKYTGKVKQNGSQGLSGEREMMKRLSAITVFNRSDSEVEGMPQPAAISG